MLKTDTDLSVIVPSYNKALALQKTLLALDCQTIDRTRFEVLVIDDGSTDATERIVTDLGPSFRCRFIRQEHQGAGAARNLGASLAKGDLLLFLDSDIMLDTHAVAQHLDAHRRFDRALVVSRILPVSPNPIGQEDLIFQRGFDFGPSEKALPWHCALTQALSIKKHHFQEIGLFAVDLPRGQDIELGFRASRLGFEIQYCATAIGIHNHALPIEQRCQLERQNHKKLVILFQRYPELLPELAYLRHKLPVDWRKDPCRVVAIKTVRRAVAARPALGLMECAWHVASRLSFSPQMRERLYWSIVGSYQILGLREGMRTYGPISTVAREA